MARGSLWVKLWRGWGVSHGDACSEERDRALGRQGDVRTQGPTRSQCGQSLGVWEEVKEMSSERSAGVEVRRYCGTWVSLPGRCAPQEALWHWNPSGQQSQRHWGKKELSWKYSPQAGSRCYWPCTTCLGHHQVTQHPPLPLLKGLSSGSSCPLHQVLGNMCVRICGGGHPQCRLWPHPALLVRIWGCWDPRKFPDLSPLKEPVPDLGSQCGAWSWPDCALFSLQAPTQGQALESIRKRGLGYTMEAEGHCRKVPTPPCPRIQSRPWELEWNWYLEYRPHYWDHFLASLSRLHSLMLGTTFCL